MTLDLATAVLVADVSGWQTPDVSSLAHDGFAAVIVKVTEGNMYANRYARQQAESTLAGGMKLLGKYDFGQPGDGRAQADLAVHALADLPWSRTVLDAEVAGLDAGFAVPFGERCREWNDNVRPLLYASTSYYTPHFGGSGAVRDLFDGWPAQYRDDNPRTWPATAIPAPRDPFDAWVGWQFTSHYPSSIGRIDASVFDPVVLGPPPPPAIDWPAIQQAVWHLEDGMPYTAQDDNGVYWFFSGNTRRAIDAGAVYGLATIAQPVPNNGRITNALRDCYFDLGELAAVGAYGVGPVAIGVELVKRKVGA